MSEKASWIKDIVDPKQRRWEEMYRNRFQHDKLVRSTHGVNCTGSCSWMVCVKDGIVTWETQATDYPLLESGLPPYEPRGCQRGISYSWYLYSPLRVKYPYVRGALFDLWKEARSRHKDPVEAWKSIVEDPQSRARYQNARGKGGFRRATWDEVLEIIAASTVNTIKKYGPDRVIGFSPIPAMSQLSYAAGARFLQLLGGVNLSFYDWYCDLPPASPEIWGEQTDVAESADWYNSKYIVDMGANLNMTRTPDVHYVAEARHNGTKFVVLSPDFSMVSKYSDWWIPLEAGQDGAFWMAANHVILNEFFVKRQVPYFTQYMKQYTDAPFLVRLDKKAKGYEAGRLLRANLVDKYKDVENGDWKFLFFDEATKQPKMPKGTVGFRWANQKSDKGKWNLELKDGLDDSPIDPMLTFIDYNEGVIEVNFTDFGDDKVYKRGVPVRYIDTPEGKVPVTTGLDLLMAQFGVGRGLPGSYARSYDDDASYTPAWQEKFTGINRKTIIQFAREFAGTAEKTNGKCCIIVGAGVNHWYHNNLMYRAGIVALMLTGSVGRNGGGLNHYVGQEKLAPQAPWATITFALDWKKPPRVQNAPSWHYVHTDQWRYDSKFSQYDAFPKDDPFVNGHTIDHQNRAVRMGWLPCYPQFNKHNFSLVREAERKGARKDADVVKYVVDQLKSRKLKFSMEDPDAPENWPRVWFIWRGNALMASAKGHEYFLKHYLGTHTNAIADEVAENLVSDVVWHKEAPKGKIDLVVDLNFRMDTSALYSDIVLPAATWYEKADINSTDMHTYMNCLSAAVPPAWESKSDWEIFKLFALKISELAPTHLPDTFKDIVAVPLAHDQADEISQPTIKDWGKGECEPIPGKTMPKFAIVERDYVNLHNHYISFGPLAREQGIGAHGISWQIKDVYDKILEDSPVEEFNGKKYPSVSEVVDAINIILRLAPETNGEMAYRAFQAEEAKVGLPLVDLAEGSRDVQYTYNDLQAQSRRLINSPVWTGLVDDGRAYTSFCINYERLVPWRTLTGRQHYYLDHEAYIAFGEHLPTYKPKPSHKAYGDIIKSSVDDSTLVLNYLTPHGKWHIHSTYGENHRMITLSRGIEPVWISEKDADRVGITDNDWVEVHNDNGVVCTRAVVSARIPEGVCIIYHSPERTVGIPKSPLRGNKRGGGHNSLTRTRLKPLLMVGGYGQFTYGFNYWGPTGVNRDTFVLVKKVEGKVSF